MAKTAEKQVDNPSSFQQRPPLAVTSSAPCYKRSSHAETGAESFGLGYIHKLTYE